jgi:hypothetical protein
MRAILRRLDELEKSFTPKADLRMQHLADVLWERRQQRLKAQGLPFETVKPQYSPGPYMSVAETLRRCHQERVERWRRERETGAKGDATDADDHAPA